MNDHGGLAVGDRPGRLVNARDGRQSVCQDGDAAPFRSDTADEVWPADVTCDRDPVFDGSGTPPVAVAAPVVCGFGVGGGTQVAVTVPDKSRLGHNTPPIKQGAAPSDPYPLRSLAESAQRPVKRNDPRYHKRWHYDRAQGIKRSVDPGPARAHIAELRASGLSYADIGAACGLTRETVRQVAALGRPTMQRRIAEAILTVTPQRGAESSLTRSGIGTIRRVQALLAIGWRHQDIRAYGVDSDCIIEFQPVRVQRATYEAACAAYDSLWSRQGPSRVTRARARAAGYATPLMWDDDSIDDPSAKPDRGVEGSGVASLELVMELIDAGDTIETAARRLGVTEDAIVTAARRKGTPAQKSRVARACEDMKDIRRGLAS